MKHKCSGEQRKLIKDSMENIENPKKNPNKLAFHLNCLNLLNLQLKETNVRAPISIISMILFEHRKHGKQTQ